MVSVLEQAFTKVNANWCMFLIGGGIGNIYDRIVYGSVTDFLHMDFVLFRTGIFNLADVSIMVGIGLLLLQNLTAAKIKKQEATQGEIS